MFDIAFLNREPERQGGGWYALRGRLVLGQHAEEFMAALGSWDRAAYEKHWVQAARRIVDGRHDRTGFFTSAFQFFWPMWRRDDELLVHQKLLIEDTLLEPFDQADPYRQIGEYTRLSEDGTLLSEWRVPVDDLIAFFQRREGKSGAAER